MAVPICLSPLKFYDNILKQERYKAYAYNHIAPLITKANYIPPFQFVYNSELTLSNAVLKPIYNESEINVLESINAELYFNNNVFQYLGNYSVLNTTVEGNYYLELTFSDNSKLYSEIMCFTNSLDECIKIEYWNPEADFTIKGGKISFANGFVFRIYLKTELGKPNYTFEEEATSRLGYSFIESQVSKKVYNFNALIPEYICDALRIIRLCSNKRIINKSDTYDMLTFNMDVDWQEQGDIASVNCEFEVDNIIVNLGGIRAEDYYTRFNNDFNNDFEK